LNIKRTITIASITLIIPISSFIVMVMPFIFFIEKIVVFILSIVLVRFLIRKIDWLQTKNKIKKIYFVLLYAIGTTVVLLMNVLFLMFEGVLLERKIDASGVYYTRKGQTFMHHHEEVILFKVGLSKRSSYVNNLDLECTYAIQKDNEGVFLDCSCNEYGTRKKEKVRL
jgi:hypothetical protein